MLPRITAALAALERPPGVRVLYACESGSRAWGFPSPDSDYDVRFIYCHPPAWYLALDEDRDTIEQPVSELLDLGGWELRKALRLLRASNAAAQEWLQSPIVYHEVPGFRASLLPLMAAAFIPKAGLHHYAGMMRRGLAQDLAAPEVRLKRLFYALRATLAARWIRLRGTVPPMTLAALREVLPADLAPTVDELLIRKAGAVEKALVPRPAALAAFMEQELAAGEAARDGLPPRGPDPTPALDALLRRFVQSGAGA